MNDLIINVTAGLISSVLAPFVITRLGGGTPPAAHSVSIDGDHNTVTQSIDNSQTSIEVIYEQLPARAGGWQRDTNPTSSNGGSTQGDPWSELFAWALAAVALVLTYFFIWPAVVWAFVGAAAGITLLTTWTVVTTRDTPGPRITATVLMLISSAVMLVAAWWTLHGGPGSDISFTRLEATVAERHPAFSSGIEGRWTTVTTHPGDILSALGMSGFLFVLTQAGALAFAAVMVWARVQEIAGWIALHNMQRKDVSRRLVDRAVHFKEVGVAAVIGTLVAGSVICFVAGGWAHSLLEEEQEYPVQSVIDQ